nr:MAG TPA: hypothetical protein [Caudoviricetes sp.]
METQVVTAWEIKSFDLIILRGRHYFVLSKNLVPLGGEIGFCINFTEQGRRERSWQFFRWNERISRIV